MKNHIVFKFIAVLLCAASLLGVVGSAAGILVLTEEDLYNKTVDQVAEEKFRSDGEEYAHILALRHASTNLGGCPEELVSQSYTAQWFNHYYDPDYYGYSVIDAEGNVVAGYNETLGSSARTYTFSPTGQYMYLTSLMLESEKYAPVIVEEQNGETYIYDAIPEHGTTVEGFTVTYSDNSSEGIAVPDGIGELFHDSEGYAQFYSYEPIEVSDVGGDITHILFYNDMSEAVFEASSPNQVGFFNYTGDGTIVFHATVSPETIGTAVYSASFYDKDMALLYEISSDHNIVGYYSCDEDGYAAFRTDKANLDSWTESNSLDAGYVHGISLLDENGNVLYKLYGTEPVGFVYPDGSDIVFMSSAPVPAAEPEPTVPETVPETTVAETLPEETVAETQAEEAAEEPVSEESGEETSSEETETPVEETEAYTEETVPSSASAVPEEETAAPEEAAEDAGEAEEATEAPTEPEPTEAPETTEAPAEPEPTVVETAPVETIHVEVDFTMPVLINGKSIDEYEINTDSYYDSEMGENMYVEYVYTPMPEYTVELYIAPGAVRNASAYDVLRIVREYRSYLLPVLGISLLIFAVFAVYLCCAAGRKPKSDVVKAAGLNAIPLDLYICLCIGGVVGIGALGAAGTDYFQRHQNLQLGIAFALAASLFACLLIVAFFFAFVAQIKTPGGYWWRNTLCARFLMLFVRFGVWLEQFLSLKFFPWLGRIIKSLWKTAVKIVIWLYHACENAALWIGRLLGRIFHWIGGKFHRFLSLLPLTWQWVLAGCVIVFIAALTLNSYNSLAVMIGLVLIFGIILYAANCFGTLFESTKHMSKGDLDTKVDDKLMVGCFKDFAHDLNDLADVAVVAAQKQLKSERMKTELITNVSHDIKTPLTSIINYVDLLQKPHTDAEQEQYLEVLDRQSQRLKKLIDDLMEMSKASTGNMAVDITLVDAVESVNQALGEFADKLDKAQLVPVFRHTEESVAMMADGRLVWRVMSNLLTNAVKYAMPGTRLYIDLMELEGKVVISLKNISRDELNVDADELMERFVRGDDSRNTEGSGLGLNIAKSLMELQKGQLQLLVDGDLFKVTLIFPGA